MSFVRPRSARRLGSQRGGLRLCDCYDCRTVTFEALLKISPPTIQLVESHVFEHQTSIIAERDRRFD